MLGEEEEVVVMVLLRLPITRGTLSAAFFPPENVLFVCAPARLRHDSRARMPGKRTNKVHCTVWGVKLNCKQMPKISRHEGRKFRVCPW